MQITNFNKRSTLPLLHLAHPRGEVGSVISIDMSVMLLIWEGALSSHTIDTAQYRGQEERCIWGSYNTIGYKCIITVSLYILHGLIPLLLRLDRTSSH